MTTKVAFVSQQFLCFLFLFISGVFWSITHTSTISRRVEDFTFRQSRVVEHALPGEVADLTDQQAVSVASQPPSCEITYSTSEWTSGEVTVTLICDRPIYAMPNSGDTRIENCA